MVPSGSLTIDAIFQLPVATFSPRDVISPV